MRCLQLPLLRSIIISEHIKAAQELHHPRASCALLIAHASSGQPGSQAEGLQYEFNINPMAIHHLPAQHPPRLVLGLSLMLGACEGEWLGCGYQVDTPWPRHMTCYVYSHRLVVCPKGRFALKLVYILPAASTERVTCSSI